MLWLMGLETMRKIDILLTQPLLDGFAPFTHEAVQVQFHLLGRLSELPLMEGTIWAFVDWVLPDISGLEICRRLRFDPLTAQASITMVLLPICRQNEGFCSTLL